MMMMAKKSDQVAISGLPKDFISSGKSPSQQQGVTMLQERTLRKDYAKIIFEAGRRLMLSEEATATGIVIFQRYFARKSFTRYDMDRIDLIATTSIFLAGKIEEDPRRLRDVISSVHKIMTSCNRNECKNICNIHNTTTLIIKGSSNSSEKDKHKVTIGTAAILDLEEEYFYIKKEVVDCEQNILRTLAFDVDINHPYRFLMNYARTLRVNCLITKLAWGFVNDSQLIFECLQLSPQVIACAALYLAHWIDQYISSFTQFEKRNNNMNIKQKNQQEEEKEEELLLFLGKKGIDIFEKFHSIKSLVSLKTDFLPMIEGEPFWTVFDVNEIEILEVVNALLDLYSDSN